MQTSTPRQPELSPRARDVLIGLLRVHGFQELASAQLFAAGVRLAPRLDEKQMLADQARDELHHLEVVAELHEELTGTDLLEVLRERVEALPQPGNWIEMAVVAFLSDRVGNALLRSGVESSFEPYARVVQRISEAEAEHSHVTAAILREVVSADERARQQAGAYLTSWLRASLSELSGATVGLFGEAKELGLLPRDARQIRAQLLAELEPEIRAVGLEPPALEQLSALD